MSTKFSESLVEDTVLDWLQQQGFDGLHGPDIAPCELAVDRGMLSRPFQVVELAKHMDGHLLTWGISQ